MGIGRINKAKNSNENSRSKFDLGFLEYLSDGVLVLNRQYHIVAVNSALEQMVGWKSEELVGELCLRIFGCQHLDNGEPLCNGLCPMLLVWKDQAIEEGNTKLYHELTINTKAGSKREVSVSFSPLVVRGLNNPSADSGKQAAEEPDYSIMILRDITEQKRIEGIKTQFLVTASHQLRTPLAAIKASIGLVLDNLASEASAPLLRLLQNIQTSSLRMERLVNDLIELANLQSGRVTLQQNAIEVSSLVEKAIELNRVRLTNKSQQVETDVPLEALYVKGDSTRLAQILGHLLSNASKFSSEGSPIKLTVTPRPEGDSSEQAANGPVVEFSIEDKGIGISTEEQQLIFEKFYQSQIAENADGMGSGLGLPLARALVELHGGRLWLESALGRGSTFYFTLPMVAAENTSPDRI
ncbi:MAG TPA: PAS domain-containing sensor histidine kinase [Chloroflexia bacterium]|nr:PAS domain-containing sensor histidine kinase [Chloroflexia bacterium]